VHDESRFPWDDAVGDKVRSPNESDGSTVERVIVVRVRAMYQMAESGGDEDEDGNDADEEDSVEVSGVGRHFEADRGLCDFSYVLSLRAAA
jgi:hypothetical protein